MNLINDPFLPVRRKNGDRDLIAPWQVTQDHASNPIVAIDTPRPDFNGALNEFLIALLQATVAPTDEDDPKWADWLEQPPPAETLREALSSLADWFQLDGDGPRFMQDPELNTRADNKIAGLFIDAPGDNTIKNNADHFIKRQDYGPICPEAAATALWTLQSYAPSGGAGHRTSLRGGGPLTTLVVLDPHGGGFENSLWRNLWLNVLDQATFNRATGNPRKSAPADRYPWLAPTRTSEAKSGSDTYAEQVHPLRMYFAMPRRIRLDFDNLSKGHCSIYGTYSDQLISCYATKNYGANYTGNWEHPMSPHRKDPKSGESIPLHPQPGGINYRHWPGIALGSRDGTITPALVIRRFQTVKLAEEQLRVWAFGYDMDNMKARGWCDATLPLYRVAEEFREQFTDRVEQMVKGAEESAGYLRSAVKQAWFDRPGDAKGDTGFLAEAFYHHTENSFYRRLTDLSGQLASDDTQTVMESWYRDLTRAVTRLFDHWATSGTIEQENPRRIAAAHKKLQGLLRHRLPKVLGLSTRKKQEKAA